LPNRKGDKAYDLVPTQRSRELRNNATPAERKLWSYLGNRQLSGVRFNRQVVIRPYICDLVARSQKLVIEIDGGQHGDAIAYDDARTAFLEARGYRVLRFWNNDVLENIEGVVSKIDSVLNDRPSPSRLRRASPPALAGGAE
jgi:very-short-patch-repair endonuclease